MPTAVISCFKKPTRDLKMKCRDGKYRTVKSVIRMAQEKRVSPYGTGTR